MPRNCVFPINVKSPIQILSTWLPICEYQGWKIAAICNRVSLGRSPENFGFVTKLCMFAWSITGTLLGILKFLTIDIRLDILYKCMYIGELQGPTLHVIYLMKSVELKFWMQNFYLITSLEKLNVRKNFEDYDGNKWMNKSNAKLSHKNKIKCE